MKNLLTILALFCITLCISCKKTSQNQKHCWQILDISGNKLNSICDKTEAEMLACVNSGSCGIYNGGNAPLTSCEYYQLGGDSACWLINNQYFNNITAFEANHIATCIFNDTVSAPVKAICNDCQNLYTREKITNTHSNAFYYTAVTFGTYCGDSVNIIRNKYNSQSKIDSSIVFQISYNGMTFQ